MSWIVMFTQVVLLANSEGVWWENPLDKAEVYRSEFVQTFIQAKKGQHDAGL